MDIIDHVDFKIVNSICYIGLAVQSMNLMVHKCEDPTKKKHNNLQKKLCTMNKSYVSTPIHTVSCTQNTTDYMIFLLHCNITFKQLKFGIYITFSCERHKHWVYATTTLTCMLYDCEYHRVTHKFTELFVCMTIDHIISIFQSDMIV